MPCIQVGWPSRNSASPPFSSLRATSRPPNRHRHRCRQRQPGREMPARGMRTRQALARQTPSRQAVGQGPPCIGDRRTVQHPRAADSTHPPWHATARPGQPLAGSWSHFRARKSIEVAAMHQGQAKRAAPVRARRRQESKVCHQPERDATGGSMRSTRARPGLPAG